MSAAAVHLEEMRDLAGRILAMGNTLETRETGKPRVAVWDLGRELAELVQHFDPEQQFDGVWCVNPDPEDYSDEVYLFEDEDDAQHFSEARSGTTVSWEVIFFRDHAHTADIIASAKGASE